MYSLPNPWACFSSYCCLTPSASQINGVYLHTRSDGNLARLRANTKVQRVLIRDKRDAALTAHSNSSAPLLACSEFGITTRLKKTNILGQEVSSTPRISIGDYTLEAVEELTYIGSSNLSLDTELNKRIGKAASVLARLGKRIWDNAMLTISTRMKVYQACVLSTLLYSSETWTLHSCQEHRLNTFPLRCLRRILGITWQDRVPNKDVLAPVGLPSMFALLIQRRLPWLRLVSRMKNGRIPKEILYSELTIGTSPAGRPNLRFIVVCKRDLKAGNISPSHWEL